MNEENKSVTEQEEKNAAAENHEELNSPTEKDFDDEISALNRQIEELKDKYLRLYADFDNAKKRHARERQELSLSAGKDILSSFLPVLDDMERAMKSIHETADVQAIKEGLDLVVVKFKNTLEQKGVKAVNSVGEEFDVEKHEAITEIPAPTPDLRGKVIDEVEKGYTIYDKILRYAKVVVGRKD